MSSHSIQSCQQSDFDAITDRATDIENLCDTISNLLKQDEVDLKLIETYIDNIETLSSEIPEYVTDLYDGRQRLRDAYDNYDCDCNTYDLECKIEELEKELEQERNNVSTIYNKLNPKATTIDLWLELQSI